MRILAVDDNESILKLIRAMLAPCGFEVICRTSPRQALLDVQQDPKAFSAAIVDVSMLEMRGPELALRLQQASPQLPIVICTGFLDPDEEKMLATAGVQAVMEKPFCRESLLDVLASCGCS